MLLACCLSGKEILTTTLASSNALAIPLSFICIFLKEKITEKDKELATEMAGLATIGMIFLLPFAVSHITILIVFITLILMNIISFKNSKKHIFTEKGKDEYKKIAGLKKYIEDYSLMEEKNISSTILWEEYLSYAVAFGIPNKITNKINEKIMKTNIILQKIGEFIDIYKIRRFL